MNAAKPKEKVYITHNQMNKPIRMMGLSSLQLFAVIAVFGLTLVIMTAIVKASFLTILVVAAIIIILLTMLVAKLSREHKKGCPNYIKSYFTFTGTPKKIIDTKSVLSMVYNER